MTRSNTLAVAKAERDARDRRNRAIVKAVGCWRINTSGRCCIRPDAEANSPDSHASDRCAPPSCLCPLVRQARRKVAAVMAQGPEHSRDRTAAWRVQNAVAGKIDRLELPPPSTELQARKRRHAGRPPFWVAKRVANLRKLWGIKSNAAIGRKFGVSEAAVFRQAHRLGLPLRRRATSAPS